MRVLLTGGTGFLGAWTARRLLDAGYLVRIFDRSTDYNHLAVLVGPNGAALECVTGDVADADLLAAQAVGCDRIIHLAALLTPACQKDPIRGATVNLIGALAVFEAARSCAFHKSPTPER